LSLLLIWRDDVCGSFTVSLHHLFKGHLLCQKVVEGNFNQFTFIFNADTNFLVHFFLEKKNKDKKIEMEF